MPSEHCYERRPVRRRRSLMKRGWERLSQAVAKPRQTPSWLVSFLVHLAVLLILALIPIQQLTRGSLTLFMGTGGAPEIAEFALSEDAAAQVESELESPIATAPRVTSTSELLELELPEVELVDAVSQRLTTIDNPLSNLPEGIAQGLSGRSSTNKAALLEKFGGTAQTEAAVELGLKWLVKQQKSDGSWSLIGPYSDGGVSENKTAATAMALNAFLGAGHTHISGEYQREVELGLRYLLRRQTKDGFFADGEPSRQQMYAQAIATICIVEAYGMTGEYDFMKPAERALRFAEWSQSDMRGWRYNPREDADLSVTGWFVMALETGLMAGLQVDREKLERVGEYLDSVSSAGNSRYAYNHFEQPSLSMTAEGLLCRIFLGWPDSHPALLRAVRDDLLEAKPSPNESSYSVYYWYYATQVLHHLGGSAWDEWNRAMRVTLPELQQKEGREAGSWDPSLDAYGASGGRLYTTCLNLYCLEVYYRHLSLYDPR